MRSFLLALALSACPGASTVPTTQNLGEVRTALVCLHNEVRRQRDLPPLKEDAKLRRAAAAHSAEMVEESYFEHGDFVARLLESGYADDDWVFGENLAWGAGELATPAAVMAAWMDSPGQRRTILTRAFRHIGIGLRPGLPTDATVGVTITADFGARG